MDDAQQRTPEGQGRSQSLQALQELALQLAEENTRLRAFCDLAARWLLTLEQEHEKASHQDEDTRQISSQTCHVCAGIDALWQAIKEERREIIRKVVSKERSVLDRLRDHDKIFAELDDEDPEVLKLVESLADDAAAHPEKLGDVGELFKGDDELLDKP